MKALQTTAIVTPEHQLVVDVPSDVPSGSQRVVVVLEDSPSAEPSVGVKWTELAIPGSRWPVGGLSLSREDLYGDTGR
jgi:hypothetical protein